MATRIALKRARKRKKGEKLEPIHSVTFYGPASSIAAPLSMAEALEKHFRLIFAVTKHFKDRQ